jgi:rare lipoprotein A
MRLPADAVSRGLVLGLTFALAGCGMLGGGGRPSALAAAQSSAPLGPSADYPMVLGDPFTIDGREYVPADTANYDEVGYAALDGNGAGITAAHKTLPLPSYVEVTSLESGKTILVRVERRGPMTGTRLLALSPAAAAQLGAGEGAPIRVRRVNPPEVERAELRAGRSVGERMETPKALVEVLRRKLPGSGSASLQAAAHEAVAAPRTVAQAFASAPATTPAPTATITTADPTPVASYPLAPLTAKPRVQPRVADQRAQVPATVARAEAAPKPKPATAATPASGDGFVIQAGTFAVEANARKLADRLGGFVSRAGTMWRVRTGPFATRGQAEAALAKVRAAGYSDARVFTAG